MKDLLVYIVKSIVEKPDEVVVEESERDGVTVLTLNVAPEDRGKVIGRGGRMAKDLRILSRASCRDGRRVTVDIVDGE